MKQLIEAQRKFFISGKTKAYGFRIEQLKKLKDAVKRYEKQIEEALFKDMKKPAYEAFIGEIGFVYEDIAHTIKNLSDWMEAEQVSTPLSIFPSSSEVRREPLGTVLIMGPWNYPFMLVISPLTAAIAAGNTAILKPSHETPHTSAIIKKIIDETFPAEYVVTVLGGVPEAQALLAEKFDHIFFTGGIKVGKIVAQAAAKYLTPVTLELGGKSPCIIEEGVNLALAAKRIVWGKFFNAGQTCVAPDYLLVHKSLKDQMIKALDQAIKDAYGTDPSKSKDLARIINDGHFERLLGYLKSGRVVIGGQVNKAERYIAPTVLADVKTEDEVMQDEIFGPILPLLTFDTLDEAIGLIRGYSKPLALYMFSHNRRNQERVLEELSFGGGCINDVVVHLGNLDLPFGGVGESGTGAYHGKYGFETFSHRKAVVRTPMMLDPKLRYQPYSPIKDKVARLILR